MDLEFEINYGQGFALKPPPRNWRGLVLKLTFTAQQPNAVLEGTDFEWVGQNAIDLNHYIAGGLTGATPGIYEGPGLRVWGKSGSTRVKFLDGFINLSDEKCLRECDIITAPTKETGRVDWLADISAAIPFSFLRQLPVGHAGRIVPATDYKLTPYALSEIPNYTQAAMLAVSIFLTIKEAHDVVKEIGQCIQEIQGAASTASATLGLAIGLVICAIAKVLIYIIYLAILIIALINMIINLIDNIIQFKKAKACMLARVAFQRGCEYFGLQFSSSILNDPTSPYYNDTWMPRKVVIPDHTNPLTIFKRPEDESNFATHPSVYGHPDGLFRDFIVEYCNKYNGEIAIIGNTLYFEEAHSFMTMSQFQIPNEGPVGNTLNYPAPVGDNASELASNYLVIFSVDGSDLQTIHRYDGTSCEVTITPTHVNNIKNVSPGPSKAVRLNCALAKRKETLTKPEQILNDLINSMFGFSNTVVNIVNSVITTVNWVISIFGGPGANMPQIPLLPSNISNNRIGWMSISNDSFSIPKTFIGIKSGPDWLISPGSQQLMSADNLVKNFHGKNFSTRGNQQLKYKSKEFKFLMENFVAINNRNAATSPTHLPAKFKELAWHVVDEKAVEVEYRVFDKFTNNQTETIVIDG